MNKAKKTLMVSLLKDEEVRAAFGAAAEVVRKLFEDAPTTSDGMEDKQTICDILCAALQLTKGYGDVKMLEHHKSEEIVRIVYDDDYSKDVNIALDSGAAMIRDIFKNL